MKFGQLRNIRKEIFSIRNIFLKKSYDKRGRETNSRTFLFLNKALYMVNTSSQRLSFNIFW